MKNFATLFKQTTMPWLFMFMGLSVLLTTAFYWRPLIRGYSFITNVDPVESSVIFLLMVDDSVDNIRNMQAIMIPIVLGVLAVVTVFLIWKSMYRSFDVSEEIDVVDEKSESTTNYSILGKKMITDILVYCGLIMLWSTTIVVVAPEILRIPLEGFVSSTVAAASLIELGIYIIVVGLIFQALWVVSVLAHRFINS